MNFGVNFRFRIRGARDRAYAEAVVVFRSDLFRMAVQQRRLRNTGTGTAAYGKRKG